MQANPLESAQSLYSLFVCECATRLIASACWLLAAAGCALIPGYLREELDIVGFCL